MAQPVSNIVEVPSAKTRSQGELRRIPLREDRAHGRVIDYIRIARADHWFKNLLVLPGTVAAAFLGGVAISDFGGALVAGLAATSRAAFLCIQHVNKNQAMTRMIHRVGGSGAFTEVPRSGLCCLEDREDQQDDPADRRKLFHCFKSNLAKKPPGISFRIRDDLTLDWDATPIYTTADDAMRDKPPGPEPEALKIAVDWLREKLAGGGMPVAKLEAAADEDVRADSHARENRVRTTDSSRRLPCRPNRPSTLRDSWSPVLCRRWPG